MGRSMARLSRLARPSALLVHSASGDLLGQILGVTPLEKALFDVVLLALTPATPSSL